MFAQEVGAAENLEFTFGSPSFTPDSRKLVFDRCPAVGECRIHVHDLQTNAIAYFEPPKGQIWFSGKFSPSGKQIVFVSIPLRNPALPSKADNQDRENAQIAMMDADGGNFRYLTNSPGYKQAPNFSWSGKKIIFVQGQLRPPPSKTQAARNDAYEIDFETGGMRQLTDYQFFQMGRPSYLPGDESFVVDCNGAFKLPGIQEAEHVAWQRELERQRELYRQNNHSWVHRFKADGKSQPLVPLFTDPFYAAGRVTADAAGNIYFKAQPNQQEKFRVYRQDTQGRFTSWERTLQLQTRFAEVSPDGRLWLEISRPGVAGDLNGIFILDLQDGRWRELPAAGPAQAIYSESK